MRHVLTVIVTFACAIAPLTAQSQLMNPQKEAALRSMFPRLVDSPEIENAFLDSILYTKTEIPDAYQQALIRTTRQTRVTFGNGQFADLSGETTFVDANYNISGGAAESRKGNGFGGNGNIEFPWRDPGGTDHAPNSVNYKWMHLPRDESGNLLPVVWYRDRLSPSHPGTRSQESAYGYKWLFPLGTIFGEVLMLKDSRSVAHTYEVRVRIRESEDWGVDLFRPFPEGDMLIERIKELRPTWERDANVSSFVRALESPQPTAITFKYERLLDRLHPTPAFDVEAAWLELPPLDDEQLVADLLDTTPFESAVGREFAKDAPAPTTKADFHIVPKNYLGAALGNDRQGCFNCHQHVQHHVTEFHAGRDWYGHIRGSDEIFSFNPFSKESFARAPVPVRVNQSFVLAGIVAEYDPAIHTPDNYRRLKR